MWLPRTGNIHELATKLEISRNRDIILYTLFRFSHYTSEPKPTENPLLHLPWTWRPEDPMIICCRSLPNLLLTSTYHESTSTCRKKGLCPIFLLATTHWVCDQEIRPSCMASSQSKYLLRLASLRHPNMIESWIKAKGSKYLRNQSHRITLGRFV